jgi:hypothetical protein
VSIPVWPDDLPCSVIMGSLQTAPRGVRLATAPDAGPPKQRRRGPKTMPVSCVIKVSANQRARFDRFWEDDTGGGVAPFLFRDQLIDGYKLGNELGQVLLTEAGAPITIGSWWLVQFGQQQPAYSRVTGRVFQISFDLIVLP